MIFYHLSNTVSGPAFTRSATRRDGQRCMRPSIPMLIATPKKIFTLWGLTAAYYAPNPNDLSISSERIPI
ncbi:MAG: hypothetical protein EBZ48_13230, partial [Proteobacteria bacterium]|nr:hypothetical protein [Pseudomonadota bacterium]